MPEDRRRIDKWLWFARVAKTRTAAQKLAISGRVRVNRDKNESASRLIRVGDVLTIALDSGVRVLRINNLGLRRGPAVEARLLFEDLSPPAKLDGPQPRRGGRPTKRDRRTIDHFRRGDHGADANFAPEDK